MLLIDDDNDDVDPGGEVAVVVIDDDNGPGEVEAGKSSGRSGGRQLTSLPMLLPGNDYISMCENHQNRTKDKKLKVGTHQNSYIGKRWCQGGPEHYKQTRKCTTDRGRFSVNPNTAYYL